MIRKAVPEDLNAILELLWLMHHENDLSHVLPPDVQKVTGHVIQALETGWVVVACENDGKVVGALGMVYSTTWWSSAPILQELWNFVHPDHRRGTRHAWQIMKVAEQLVTTSNMPFWMGVFSNKRTAAKCQLYAKFFPMVGQIFFAVPRGLTGAPMSQEPTDVTEADGDPPAEPDPPGDEPAVAAA